MKIYENNQYYIIKKGFYSKNNNLKDIYFYINTYNKIYFSFFHQKNAKK